MIKSLLYFVAAGLCEIGGGYRVYKFLKFQIKEHMTGDPLEVKGSNGMRTR